MIDIPFRYVSRDVDRHGNIRYYFRRPGQKKVRLPPDSSSKAFREAYELALAGTGKLLQATKSAPPGSFRHSCVSYYRSAQFKTLDVSTQSWQRRYLDQISTQAGQFPIRSMKRKHIVKLISEGKTGSVSRNTLKALRALFRYALDIELIEVDPSIGVRPLPYHSEGHHTWTKSEIKTFAAYHSENDKAILALYLLLFTACRRQDVVRLGWHNVIDERIKFRQQKNSRRKPVDVDIPIVPILESSIELCEQRETFLVTEYGKPFTANGFGNWFKDRCKEAGLSHCSAHGLRKAIATLLAEGDATPHEIQAITGHQTLTEVERYCAAASRAKLADKGFEKLKWGT